MARWAIRVEPLLVVVSADARPALPPCPARRARPPRTPVASRHAGPPIPRRPRLVASRGPLRHWRDGNRAKGCPFSALRPIEAPRATRRHDDLVTYDESTTTVDLPARPTLDNPTGSWVRTQPPGAWAPQARCVGESTERWVAPATRREVDGAIVICGRCRSGSCARPTPGALAVPGSGAARSWSTASRSNGARRGPTEGRGGPDGEWNCNERMRKVG